LLRLLVESGARLNFLVQMFEAKQTELIAMYLCTGADQVNPNICNSAGLSLLMIAVANDDIQTVSEILKCPRLDIGKVDQHRNTALHYATIVGNPEIVKMLTQHGASIKAKNNDNKTPVELLRKDGREELANWMEGFHRERKFFPFFQKLEAKIQVLENQVQILKNLVPYASISFQPTESGIIVNSKYNISRVERTIIGADTCFRIYFEKPLDHTNYLVSGSANMWGPGGTILGLEGNNKSGDQYEGLTGQWFQVGTRKMSENQRADSDLIHVIVFNSFEQLCSCLGTLN